MLSLRPALLVALVLGACASTKPPAKPVVRADAPIGPADRTDLCEAQADRAARCPGPPPEAIAACTARMECLGDVLRPEIVRGLTRCAGDARDCRPCTLERAALAVRPTEPVRELAIACRRRQAMCPSLDCDAIVRPLLPLTAEAAAPVADCLALGGTCLEVAGCVLRQMEPIVERAERCAPARGGGGAPSDAGPPALP